MPGEIEEPPVAPPIQPKGSLASDFVAGDKDVLHADETQPNLPPPAPEGPKGKPGRKRSDNPSPEALRSRERYARMKEGRAAPPSFSDLPGAAAAAPAAALPGKPVVNYKANAEALFLMATGALSMIVSSEWQAENDTEKETMVNSLAQYMEYKRWDDISPGWGLTLMITLYTLPRLKKPETKAKIENALKSIRGEKQPKEKDYADVT